MITRGTYQNKENLGFESRYILAYKKLGKEIGVSFFDI